MPWRYKRADPSLGNRFVSDRYYTLFGASNQFGQIVSMFSLRVKVCRKFEAFNRPNPMVLAAGSLSAMVPVGGAAVGCIMWQTCKTHVGNRCIAYGALAVCGIFAFATILIGTLCSAGTAISFKMEESAGAGKKGKKKETKVANAKFQTMVFSIVAVVVPLIGASSWVIYSTTVFKSFSTDSYYPYPGIYVGTALSFTAIFLNTIPMTINLHRLGYIGKTEPKGEEKGEKGQEG